MAFMNADFTHLHVHTQYSLLDSALRMDEMLRFASQDGMEAVAVTDHGQLFGAVDFFVRAKEIGIKPIIGCEVYMAPGSRLMKGTHFGVDDEIAPHAICRSGMHHLVLLCVDEMGYRNLCQLITKSYFEGFYYRPRIDKEILALHSEGLIATSACLKGEVATLCLQGDRDRAREAAQWYHKVFGGRFYLELAQNGLPQQMVVNQRFMEMSESLGIAVIATADCHYQKKGDAKSQEVLMCIQSGRTIENPQDIRLISDEFYFKPQGVMKEEFKFCPQAISNTMEIAKQCHFEFKFTDPAGRKIYHFPKFSPPEEISLEQYLSKKAREGLGERLRQKEARDNLPVDEVKKFEERLEGELSVINEMGFAGYYLIVADFIRYAKDHHVPVGPGRGSGAGSLVAYALGITELDPIEHGLLFERFLNLERVSLPDFDIDFCMENRDKVIQYVSQKYGADCVAQIITYGKLQARGVIRDVGRVFCVPASGMDKIAKMVPESLNITLDEALAQEPRLRKLFETDPKIRDVFDVARQLEGLYRHASIHAAGIVISNRSMVEHCPLYRGKNGEVIVQYDMNHIEKLGLIKFDFLGLKTLTFLKRAQDLVNSRHSLSLDLNWIDLKDKPLYELLSNGDTQGIFQLESTGMQDLLRRIRPSCFADVCPINALYRPGPIGSGMLDDFIERKNGQLEVEYDFEELRPNLEETYGVIVYQEQVQQIAMQLASYTAGGADILRRAMGKKKPAEMEKQKKIFVEGAIKNGFDATKSERVFDRMAKFAGYGFNKSHATAYALIACQTAYLKAHHVEEFFAALLSTEMGDTDKVRRYITDAKRHGIVILPPDINESHTDFTIVSKSQIRFGLGAIKGVGNAAIDSILSARQKNGNFKDLYDLCARANPRRVNKKVLEALVKAGALDGFGAHRASLFAAVDGMLEVGSVHQRERDELQGSFSDWLADEGGNLGRRPMTYPEKEPWLRSLKLKHEKETIGFFVTGHPLDGLETELQRFSSASLAECQKLKFSREVMVGAYVSELREILTRHGERMAFGTLEDKTDQLEVVIFSDSFNEGEALLKSDEPLWIRGQLEVNDKSNKLILSKKKNARILPLPFAYEALARELHFYIQMDEGTTEKLPPLVGRLEAARDKQGVPVFVHLRLKAGVDSVLKMKGSVSPTRELIGGIETLFGKEKMSVEFR